MEARKDCLPKILVKSKVTGKKNCVSHLAFFLRIPESELSEDCYHKLEHTEPMSGCDSKAVVTGRFTDVGCPWLV